MHDDRETHGIHVSCGILYNQGSPRETQVVIERLTAAQPQSRQESREVRLGNLDDVQGWGHANDFVRHVADAAAGPADDYVLAQAFMHSLRDLVRATFGSADLNWDHE
jgi:GDP-D-mannose dehydratase